MRGKSYCSFLKQFRINVNFTQLMPVLFKVIELFTVKNKNNDFKKDKNVKSLREVESVK